jgi:hypothetical protein
LKSAKYVSKEQLSFEKPVAQGPSHLKAGQANFAGFLKAFRMVKKLLIKFKIKNKVSKYEYLPGSLLTQAYKIIPL